MNFIKKIDFSDIIILFGFVGFSYGVAVKYCIADMCMVSGGILILSGLFFARAGAKVKK